MMHVFDFYIMKIKEIGQYLYILGRFATINDFETLVTTVVPRHSTDVVIVECDLLVAIRQSLDTSSTGVHQLLVDAEKSESCGFESKLFYK